MSVKIQRKFGIEMKNMFTKVVCAASLMAGAFLSAHAPAFALTTQVVLDDADVAKIVTAAEHAMVERKVKGCIAIANAEGVMIYFHREAGSYSNCNGSGLVKAKAAAEFRMKTQDAMAELDKNGEVHLLKVPDMAPLPGGSPLTVDGTVVGGVGISTPDGNIDIPVAEAAAEALGGK
jgi:glc operon protein GlcG